MTQEVPERQTARARAVDSSGTRPEMSQTQTASVPTQTARSKRDEILGDAAAAARAKTVKGIVKPPEWGDVIDPDGDCRIAVDPQRDRATIFVPGRPHILSAEIGRVNAPRVLRELKGDFDVKVRVTGTDHPGGRATASQYAPYHGAGILVWQDQENYVRLEIATDLQRGKSRSYVNFEYRKEGSLVVSSGLPNGDGSNHLRLKRRGNEIHAAFGPDGLRWTSFPPLFAKLNDRLNVGVLAINTATKPLTAELEGFEVSEQPASAENGDTSRNNSVPARLDGRQPSP
jgi:regulation of enolase protein 1 (concanavalin A-like superfamily)